MASPQESPFAPFSAEHMPLPGELIELKDSTHVYESCGHTMHKFVVLHGYPTTMQWRSLAGRPKCWCVS